MKKTNAMRLLDQKKVAYEVVEYEVDPEDLSGSTVAGKIGLPPEQVFKTLLARSGKTQAFAVVPVDKTLDLKRLASEMGQRKLSMVPVKELQSLTGYIRGGVTVLGAKKAFPVFVDRSALAHDVVSISAGRRGMQILLDPRDYVELVDGRWCSIAGD